ncbi:hypothetical protein GGR51DRAFT_513975 [Nemania sp. FL0031]|nr:hypothetical protein GGR51DRAFT_513975 [Nemania sp. FL0031]
MHVTSIAIAARIMLAAFALPFNNDSTSDSTRPGVEALKQPGIPIKYVSCTFLPISKEYSTAAKEAIVEWGKDGNKVEPTGLIAMSFPESSNSTGSVTWIICNSKWYDGDPVPGPELDQAETAIENKCGPNESGRVWSKKWRKEYVITTQEWVRSTLSVGGKICNHL